MCSFFCFFFCNDPATPEIYTLSLPDALPICPAFYTARCSLRRRPAFHTAHFSLRQRSGFLYCQFLVAATPRFLYCPVFVAAAPLLFILPISRCGNAPLFILPISRCGSARAFYTYQFSLRQHLRFLFCPFLVAAAPPLFKIGRAHV